MKTMHEFVAAPDGQDNSPDGQDNSSGQIDLSSIFLTLWRGKFPILLAALICTCIGGYYAYFSATPVYRATAVVILNARQENVVDLESVIGEMGRDSITINSEVEVLKSRMLMEDVVRALNLTRDPEFNPALRPPSLWAQIKTRLKEILGRDDTAATSSWGSAEQAALAEQRTLDRTVNSLLGAVTISNVPRSLVFQITAETEGPTKSARIADAMVDQYIQNQLSEKFKAMEQASGWLSTRVAELQTELEEAETKVKNFRSETELVSPEALTALERQLKELRNRLESTRDTREGLEAKLVEMTDAQTPQDKVTATGDPQLRALLPRISEADIARSFDTRFNVLLTQLQRDITRSERQISALETSEVELSEQLDQQQADLITLQQLTREAEASRLLYEYFLTRLKETSAQQGIQQADSRILSNAVIPGGPSAPRKSLILAMSAFFGVLLGASLVLLRESGQKTFRTARDLEQATGYTAMGQIPLLPARRRKDIITYLEEKPSSAAAEAIRNLRTSMLLSNIDHPPQIIATTSSTPGEGKTTISLAMAQNLSTMGKKVLIIEGDVRRRIFSQYLSNDRREGLISVLSGQNRFDDCVIHEELIGADVLLAEQSTINAADLFSSESFARLLTELRQKYDMIVIDTPPVLVVPDARIIAQHVDAMLFVVAWDQTSRRQVSEALHMFESLSSSANSVKGVILNKISPRGMRQYGYGGSYGAYSSYGRRYYVN